MCKNTIRFTNQMPLKEFIDATVFPEMSVH